MRSQVLRLLADDPTDPAIWAPTDINDCIDLAVGALSEVCPNKDRTILSIQIEVHKVEDTTQVIAAADASTQATVNTLLNEIKTDYGTHLASTTYHRAADTTNTVAAADASSLATSLTLAIELIADINAHFIESGVHMVDDALNLIAVGTPVDLATVIVAANKIKEMYTKHLSQVTDGRILYVNSVIADTAFIRLEGIEYPVGSYPATLPSFDYHSGNFLKIKTNYTPGDTGELVYVYWQKKHTFSDSASTIPVEYEPVISLGAEGYALRLRAVSQFHQAITDLGTAKTELAKMITGGVGTLQLADDALDKVTTYIESATAPSSKKYLGDGDAFLETVNVGEAVAPTYGDYARHSAQMAETLINEAAQRLAMNGLYNTEAEGYRNAALSFIEAGNKFWEDAQRRLSQFFAKLKEVAKDRQQLEKPQNLAANLWI